MATSIVQCARYSRRVYALIWDKYAKYIIPNSRRILRGKVLFAAAMTKVSTGEMESKLEEPDPSKLSREYLIKSACINTTEQAGILLLQTALALQQAEKEYAEAMFALVVLMEYKLKVLGDDREEARIWDYILAGRDLVNTARVKKHNLEMILTSAQNMLNTAAEVAYMTGGDIAGSCAGDRLVKVELYLKPAQRESEEAELKLREVEVKTVTVEGKYAEELERKNAEELERQKAEELERQKKEQSETGADGEDTLEKAQLESTDIEDTSDSQKSTDPTIQTIFDSDGGDNDGEQIGNEKDL